MVHRNQSGFQTDQYHEEQENGQPNKQVFSQGQEIGIHKGKIVENDDTGSSKKNHKNNPHPNYLQINQLEIQSMFFKINLGGSQSFIVIRVYDANASINLWQGTKKYD